jgi:uncharacterized protein (TIGR03435 family)
LLWLPGILGSQVTQQFEVAVIRPNPSGAAAGTAVNLYDGGRIKITNEPVKLLVRMAFQIQNAQIAGGPGWLDSERYNIEAKTGSPEKIQPDQLSVLMRSLLAERFHLVFHRETRELPVQALKVAKSGPKLPLNTEGGPGAMTTKGGPSRSQLIATGVSMRLLAGYIGNRLSRIVVDQTGLSNSYDFTLDWAPEETADSAAPSLVTALREQLGLRLEAVKSPVEVLVIDRIDRPSEN